MCGIAGFFLSDAVDPDRLGNAMQQAIRYRGLDGEGSFRDTGVLHLCHARLAVLDLETGHQPMADASDRFVIVQNGEVYNYLELRAEYEALGARFRTHSDTEVILEGFRLKGAAVCNDLNGMFAFAIWDKRERRLFLARDRMGKKPLYWTSLSGRLYFASSLDAFASIPGWSGKLVPEMFELQAHFGMLSLSYTVYEQARALPPASYAWASPERAEPDVTRYWAPRFDRMQTADEAEALEQCEALLTDAIRIRLRADVPVALTFSGGVDSGLIAALAAKKLNRSLTCFCIDYDTPDDPSPETAIAVRTAELLGLPLTCIHFDYHADLLPLLKEAYRCFDQPITQMPIAYNLKLYQAIKPLATVVLSGAGGDELFAGYNGNEVALRNDTQRPLQRMPAWLRGMFPERIADRLRFYKDFPPAAVEPYRTDSPIRQVVADELAELMSACGVNSYMDLLMFGGLYISSVDGNYRVPDINGLQAQVEVRSPFLDYRFVEFSATLPAGLKIHDMHKPEGNKWLLKRLYERYVPADIAWAAKKGMGWNIRFDRSFVTDPGYATAFAATMRAYAAHGFATEAYQDAFEQFQIEKPKNMDGAPPCGNVMATAFMQGQWLLRDREGER